MSSPEITIAPSDLGHVLPPEITIAPSNPQYSTSLILSKYAFLRVSLSLGGAGITEEANFSVAKSKDTINQGSERFNHHHSWSEWVTFSFAITELQQSYHLYPYLLSKDEGGGGRILNSFVVGFHKASPGGFVTGSYDGGTKSSNKPLQIDEG
ncbi:NAD(P)-binding Rossmann-fold superfamily protein [Striga asiatica]|uniref:NAD(P)-binding Rossmann-fold superfamily protein n=1 Tax=Striga asiatica TaxID=4170 RepID=A0A5A7RI07_STRAF|nr:NAD(P)-binding Rossmann-fold superfamily protein [Striga asiatica]